MLITMWLKLCHWRQKQGLNCGAFHERITSSTSATDCPFPSALTVVLKLLFGSLVMCRMFTWEVSLIIIFAEQNPKPNLHSSSSSRHHHRPNMMPSDAGLEEAAQWWGSAGARPLAGTSRPQAMDVVMWLCQSLAQERETVRALTRVGRQSEVGGESKAALGARWMVPVLVFGVWRAMLGLPTRVHAVVSSRTRLKTIHSTV